MASVISKMSPAQMAVAIIETFPAADIPAGLIDTVLRGEYWSGSPAEYWDEYLMPWEKADAETTRDAAIMEGNEMCRRGIIRVDGCEIFVAGCYNGENFIIAAG